MLGAWEESGDTSGDDVAQFDRWLASVKADAWEEGQSSGWKNREDENSYLIPSIENPYRGAEA
jgi:hypothetical protein